MNEQQRREQIQKVRQEQMQQRATAPAMSDAEAMRIASENGAITQEQVIMAAMLGKMINGGLNDLKKQSVGEGLKIGSVDMSKVMPSGIAKAIGATMQPPQRSQPSPFVEVPLVETVETFPAYQFNQPILQPVIPNIQPVLPTPEPDNQLELPFNKPITTDEVIREITIINERLDNISGNISRILNILEEDKKKLNKNLNGT